MFRIDESPSPNHSRKHEEKMYYDYTGTLHHGVELRSNRNSRHILHLRQTKSGVPSFPSAMKYTTLTGHKETTYGKKT